MSSATVVPLVVVAVLIAIDTWVYADAKEHTRRGEPVVFRAGSFGVETPSGWFASSLVLWVIFFPLYLNSRA
jgi:hypothetical protein